MTASEAKDRQPFNLQMKVEIYQRVNRVWLPHLDPYEFAVAHWLVDHCCGWGWSNGYFTKRLIRVGYARGDYTFPGVGHMMSLRKLTDVLNSLRAKRIIQTKQMLDGNTLFEVNIDWTPGEEMPPKLKLPKKKINREGVQDMHSPRAPRALPPCTSCTPYKTVGNGKENSNPSPEAQGGGAQEAIEAGRKKNAQAVSRKAERARRSVSVKALFDTFALAWDRHYAEKGISLRPVPTKQDLGCLIGLKKMFSDPQDLHGFLEFCVEHWPRIMRTEFGWMTKSAPPDIPSLGFIYRFVDGFQSAYAKRESEAFVQGLEGVEQRIAKKVARGLSREESIYEVAKEDAVAAERASSEAAKSDAARRLRAAEKALEASRRMAYGKDKPHPRSGEMRRPKKVAVTDDTPELEELPDMEWD